MQYNTKVHINAQYNGMQYIDIQHYTVHDNIKQYNAILVYITIQCYTIKCNAMQYITIQNKTQYNPLQYNTAHYNMIDAIQCVTIQNEF